MFIVYQTINKLNLKVYVGVHETDDLDDDYLGSGEVLAKAIQKYGRRNFVRQIINVYIHKENAYNLERKIVNEEFIKDSNNYNIRIGGDGGNGGPECNQKISEALKGRPTPWAKTKEFHNKRVNTIYRKYGKDGFSTFKGKTHSTETIAKMREEHKGKHEGKLNSQFGTCWIYSPVEKTNKKIRNSELQTWVDKGWVKGRKMKF